MAQYLQALYGLYGPKEKFEGQGMVEYALLLALISVVAIAVLLLFADPLTATFEEVLDALTGAAPAPTT